MSFTKENRAKVKVTRSIVGHMRNKELSVFIELIVFAQSRENDNKINSVPN